MSRYLIGAFLVFLYAASAASASCTKPKASVTASFSTQDATILTQLAHIGEFTLSCGNNASPNLFAEFPCGKVVPVARVGEAKYQISWTEDIKKGSSGTVVIRLFDEEGYASIRKAQRDGDKVSAVKSLVDISLTAKSAYKGPWVNAELLAAFIVAAIAYFAFTTKGKVQS